MKKSIRDWFRELLELMFAAAALVIDTIRTFFLVVLAILGPIAFAISVWDGFQSTLTQWITRYISVYLWLPVSDLFSSILAKIQVLMLQNDISELQNNPNFSIEASNGVYIIFMLIGIIGYFTVPTVAGWIIQSGGAGNYQKNVSGAAGRVGGFVGGLAGATAGNITGRLMSGNFRSSGDGGGQSEGNAVDGNNANTSGGGDGSSGGGSGGGSPAAIGGGGSGSGGSSGGGASGGSGGGAGGGGGSAAG